MLLNTLATPFSKTISGSTLDTKWNPNSSASYSGPIMTRPLLPSTLSSLTSSKPIPVSPSVRTSSSPDHSTCLIAPEPSPAPPTVGGKQMDAGAWGGGWGDTVSSCRASQEGDQCLLIVKKLFFIPGSLHPSKIFCNQCGRSTGALLGGSVSWSILLMRSSWEII